MVPADEPAVLPGERLVSASAVSGPSVQRPMGSRSDLQCWVEPLKASVVPQSLEPQGEVGSIWRSLVVENQGEAETLLAPVHQWW